MTRYSVHSGYWYNDPQIDYFHFRYDFTSDFRSRNVGFRLIKKLKQ